MTTLEKLKLLIPEEKNETLLNLMLEMAEKAILDYCNLNELPESLEQVKVEVAVARYNRTGDEGETAKGEGGRSVSYDELLSPDIKRQLNRYRKLVW